MSAMFVFLIPALIIVAVMILFSFFTSARKKSRISDTKVKDRSTILKEINRKLSSNPKDTQALQTLAELHYTEKNYSQAMKTYGILLDLCAANSRLDQQVINLYFGLSAMKAGVWNEAYKSLVIARTKDPENFEINSSLGNLEYRRGNYEKSVALSRQALKSKPNERECLRSCGLSLYKLRRYKEAAAYLKGAAAGHPDDKETLFALARALYEMNQNEQNCPTIRRAR